MTTSKLTPERLRELLHYDPETGIFTRRIGCCGLHGKANSIAGTICRGGYVVIQIDRKVYKASRLAWLYMYGVWPKNQIDHKDTNKLNNKFSNLRDVTHSLNQQNVHKARKTNKLGLQGVGKKPYGFHARITYNKITKHLGYFPTAELAHAAYLRAKKIFHNGGN